MLMMFALTTLPPVKAGFVDAKAITSHKENAVVGYVLNSDVDFPNIYADDYLLAAQNIVQLSVYSLMFIPLQ